MSDRNDYYAGWYAENREAILERRRKRWRDDPAYRKRQCRRKRARPRKGKRRHFPPLELHLEGCRRVYWSAGVLASRIGRSMRTVDSWQARGLLPETPVRHGGVRYYSEEMICAVQAALRHVGGRVRGEDALWYYCVLSRWLRSDLAALEAAGDVELQELRRVYQDGALVAYTVAGAAEKLGRQAQTLANWQRYGVIPATPLRYGDEEIFTPGMVRALLEAVSKRGGSVQWNDSTLRQELREAWRPEIQAHRRRKGA